MITQPVAINTAGDPQEFAPEKWASASTDQDVDGLPLPQRQPSTGIDVLVVGAGMGGLMTTLECWRKGHNIVGILERNDGPVYSGMFPSIPNVLLRLEHESIADPKP
jgi:NADPH-dependent glutamate synthase beta subunit-like oxidoreductase